MAKKKIKKKEQAEVHPDLKGFDIKIDALGQLDSNIDIDTIKAFLDKNLNDKKLQNLQVNEEE